MHDIEAELFLQFKGKRAYKPSGGEVVGHKGVAGQRDPLAGDRGIDRQRCVGKFS